MQTIHVLLIGGALLLLLSGKRGSSPAIRTTGNGIGGYSPPYIGSDTASGLGDLVQLGTRLIGGLSDTPDVTDGRGFGTGNGSFFTDYTQDNLVSE